MIYRQCRPDWWGVDSANPQVDQQMSQLNQEIVKLTQIRSLVEQRVGRRQGKDETQRAIFLLTFFKNLKITRP